MNVATQFLDALDKHPEAVPERMIQTYFGAARTKGDQEALRQLTILLRYCDTRFPPIDTDAATVSPCKQLAERMVRLKKWSQYDLDQFAEWPAEEDEVH